MKRALSLLMVLMALFITAAVRHSHADEIQPPDGWRAPTADEAGDGWRDFSDLKYVETRGDFNGDGLPDAAKIFVSPDGGEAALFVFIGRKDKAHEAVLLDRVKGPRAVRSVGLDLVHRDRYLTACGKGYRGCREGERPEIEIKNDSIDFFVNDGAYSYFYWDMDSGTFKRVWISD